MKNLITTVGTSLFTNYMRPEVQATLSACGRGYECINEHFDELLFRPSSDFAESRFQRRINQLRRIIENSWFTGVDKDKHQKWAVQPEKFNKHASAEIKSILRIKNKFASERLVVCLIATDTVLSLLAAELIGKWFSQFSGTNEMEIKFDPVKDICKSLQVTNSEKFEKDGVPNLINICFRLSGGNYENTLINITGGYKAILPYMTIFAQVNNVDLYYIFEETSELIHIPRAPISIDWNLFEKFWIYFSLLDNDEIRSRSDFSYNFLKEAVGCLEYTDQEVVLNTLGKILWSTYKRKFFLFLAPDKVWDDISHQKDIQRIISGKFADENLRNSKREKKKEHYVFDDGNNNNRIYYFEEEQYIYIYKTFESEEKAKMYIDESIDKEKIITFSKIRKVEVTNV